MKKREKTLGLFDLMKMYPIEESVIRYMEQMRWGDDLH